MKTKNLFEKFIESDDNATVLEQPIPYRSPIHALDRIAVLSDPNARFTPVHEPKPRMDYEAIAHFFADHGLMYLEKIFEPSTQGGKPVFRFTGKATGIISRAVRANPELYGRLFPGSIQ